MLWKFLLALPNLLIILLITICICNSVLARCGKRVFHSIGHLCRCCSGLNSSLCAGSIMPPPLPLGMDEPGKRR
ncbi:hypothetical protein CWM66_05935 [Kosakonia sp. H7A]|nr:hypothetical protein [Kosakonia sp. MH5]PTA93553.1 hypothetical protein CWM66_05935 [Kosakonia sp. H7A]